MSNTTSKKRPIYRNIHIAQIVNYRLPLAGKLSILHRVSGVLLFLALPLILLPLFDKSLTSELTFAEMKALVDTVFFKVILLGLIWAYMHHFCAGIRFLFLDAHVGVDKYKAAKSAASVFVVSLGLTAVCALQLFGVI